MLRIRQVTGTGGRADTSLGGKMRAYRRHTGRSLNGRWALVLSGLTWLWSCAPGFAQVAESYKVVLLPYGGTYNDLNGAGTVVGQLSGKPFSLRYPYGPNDLTYLALPPKNYTSGAAVAVNAAGDAAGWVEGKATQGRTHATVWRNGILTDLHPKKSSFHSEAVGITDTGIVAGKLEEGTWGNLYEYYAVLWQNGTMTKLPKPTVEVNQRPRYWSNCIVRSGSPLWVAGDAYTGSSSVALVWTNLSVTPTDLGWGLITGLNSYGEMVGYDSYFSKDALLWTTDDQGQTWVKHSLGHLIPPEWGVEPTTEDSRAYDMSDAGLIVGTSESNYWIHASGVKVASDFHAFALWSGDPDLTMVDLNQFLPAELQGTCVLTSARRVTWNGWILCDGTVNGEPLHSMVLIPTAP